jgi:hypothetical protein
LKEEKNERFSTGHEKQDQKRCENLRNAPSSKRAFLYGKGDKVIEKSRDKSTYRNCEDENDVVVVCRIYSKKGDKFLHRLLKIIIE